MARRAARGARRTWAGGDDVRVGWLCCGELTIKGSVHMKACDYTPGTDTITEPDLVDSVPGTRTVANAYHHAAHDLVDHADPTGLHSGPTSDGDARRASNRAR